jgi:hypothetical protein
MAEKSKFITHRFKTETNSISHILSAIALEKESIFEIIPNFSLQNTQYFANLWKFLKETLPANAFEDKPEEIDESSVEIYNLT